MLTPKKVSSLKFYKTGTKIGYGETKKKLVQFLKICIDSWWCISCSSIP